MKKQTEVRDDNRIAVIPEYGRQRLLNYAESFRDLADLFEQDEDYDQDNKQEIDDRQDYLWKRKLQENQELMAEHLKEMAHIMAQVAKETCLYHPMGERRFRQMSKLLRESGIQLRNFFKLEHEDGHMEISLTMRTAAAKYKKIREREHISVEDVAEFISAVVNTRLRAVKSAPLYLTAEWNTYFFLEEPKFHLLTGVAKAVKETEKVSGDNYSFYEMDNGRTIAILSDGMGSGDKACSESERVIELMERLLEAGFGKEAAVQMINGALEASGKEENVSTLDMCDINLYTGECEFIKLGAACTYIKRGQLVDRLSAQSFPLGVFGQVETEIFYRSLISGDYIIMLSDGVLDALSQGIGEEMLPEVIGKMDYDNPNEIANQILAYSLKQSRGQIRDDMTVLVAGIWEQGSDCLS